MVSPMIKYSFLIYYKEYMPFLDELQKMGMLHIIEKNKEINDHIKQSLYEVTELTKSIKFLEKRNQLPVILDEQIEGMAIVEKIKNLNEELSLIDQEQIVLNKEIQKTKPFGDFSKETREKFEKLNIQFRFFTCSEKKYNPAWEEEYYLEQINNIGGTHYFVVVQLENQQITIDADEIKLPEETLTNLQKKYQKNIERIESIKTDFDDFAVNYIDTLYKTRKEIQGKTDFNLAINQTEKQADEKVMFLEGWIPEEKKDELENFLNQQAVVYLSAKPTKDDKVPILLKNSKYAKLFEPIGNLFALPAYAELDLTPFFAPFYMLFFGLCVGDSGYGLVILIGTLLLRRKVKPALKPILTLASVLGASTVVMGMLTGTFFGLSLGDYDFMPFKDLFLKPMMMFYLSIAIGLAQILFGMSIKVFNQIKQNGIKHGLSTIGWILLILTLIVFMGGEKVGLNLASIPFLKNIFLILSLGLIFLFNAPDKNIFANLGLGIYESYNMVTGVFGDMLSYIRLFALGVSGSILGLVFNQISVQFLEIKYFGWIPFLALILIGHGLNIFLSCLGAFVHPMRLTFVEFYKNAGFNGGGKQYKPFSK